jgi:hypothetical protein
MKRTVLGLVILVVACASPTGPFQITRGSGSLRLANTTNRSVFYTLIESETATRVDWAPCTDPSTCSSIAPHKQGAVPYTEIAGYEAGDREAIVYWWYLEPAPVGGYQPDSIRSTRVPL